MKNLVSIIVPVYNVETYIDRCVKSLLSQSYENLEVLLVNDGSTDKSGEICDFYGSQYTNVRVIHKANGGLSEARNYGIEAATGEYITFIDSDDWIHKKYVETLYQLLVSNNADIAVCNFLSLADESEIGNHHAIGTIKVMNNAEAISALYTDIGVQMTIACGKLYRKELFSIIRFPKGRIHEDEFTVYKCLLASKKIVYTNEQLLYYWQRNDSITRSTPKLRNKLDALIAFEERFEVLAAQKFLSQLALHQSMMIGFLANIYCNKNNFSDNEDYWDEFLTLKHKILNRPLVNKKLNSTSLKYYLFKIAPKVYKFLFDLKKN